MVEILCFYLFIFPPVLFQYPSLPPVRLPLLPSPSSPRISPLPPLSLLLLFFSSPSTSPSYLPLSPLYRWTAERLLTHPWITAGDDELKAKDLSKSIEAMKKYKAKLRFKAVTNVVIMTNRMKGGFKTKSAGQMVPSPDGSSATAHSEDYKDIPEIDDLNISGFGSPSAGATEPPSPHAEITEAEEEQVLHCPSITI
jgi:hypothetical protein